MNRVLWGPRQRRDWARLGELGWESGRIFIWALEDGESGGSDIQAGGTASSDQTRSCFILRQFPLVQDFGEIENTDKRRPGNNLAFLKRVNHP